MKPEVINFTQKLSTFQETFSPRVVGELNDYQFKVVKIQGDFVWHHHADTDEAFIVMKGALNIELRDRTVRLTEGEMFIVPKGVEHRPFAAEECHALLIEPRGVVNTGEAAGELTARNDVWA